MSNISESYIHEVLSSVASSCKIKDWSHSQQKFDVIAQNYFGVIVPVVLKGKQYGRDLTLHVVLKLAPTDERYRVSGAITLMFDREIFVYSELLQKYGELQANLPIQARFSKPECYYVCKQYCKEVIAMENMCENGYLPITQSRFLDLDHVSVALKTLAQFHALSFTLKEKDSVTYDKAKSVCVPLSNETNNRFMTILIDRLNKALIKFEGSSYLPLLKILKDNCVYFVESAINRVKNVCICHGDMWKENILFKYKDNRPISACLIDYQTARMSSPAFDFLYLIVSSIDATLRSNHFKKLLEVYYETFEESLSISGLNANEIYSTEDFHYDLSIVGPMAVIIANTAIWLSSGLQEEGHVKSKFMPKSDLEKSKAINEYKLIMKGIIDDLSKFGYLNVTEMLNKSY